MAPEDPLLQSPRRFFARGWLAWLILIPAVLATLVLGVLFFALFLALLAVAALVIGLRLWWLRRRPHRPRSSEIIEAEYEVIQEREKTNRKQPK